MYALIIVIGMLSPSASAVTPVGVTSQIVGKFRNLDDCKAAGVSPTRRPYFGPKSLSHLGSQLVLCIHRRELTQLTAHGLTMFAIELPDIRRIY